MRSSLTRTTIPITLVEDRKDLVFGRLLNAACEREEMSQWPFAILDDPSQEIVRPLFRDADSAFVPTIPQFHEDIFEKRQGSRML
jgi:hypothetical protein